MRRPRGLYGDTAEPLPPHLERRRTGRLAEPLSVSAQ